ncbi:MAG: carbohydrate ABC transporter permease [Candidatus Rokubacteria bacterium]|nr:carbohydrate ABC transporter permease [Candidatus Rokubacteria bacterium]
MLHLRRQGLGRVSTTTARSKALKGIKATPFFVLLVLLALLWGAPLLWMLVTSLKHEWTILTPRVSWIPNPPTLANYHELIDPARAVNIFNSFKTSLIAAVSYTLLVLTTSSFAAFVFARLEFRGRNFLFLVVLSSIMVPSDTLMVPLYLLMYKMNWLDTYMALVLPGIGNAFGVFLLRQFMVSIPKELQEAALVDGAGYFYIFLRIIIPLSKPALATLAIFSFITNWNSFLWPLIVVSSDDMMTLPMALVQFRSSYASMDYGVVMASVMVAVLFPLLVFFFAQDFIIKGMSRTGLKG